MNGFLKPGSDFLRGQLRWKALHVLPLIDCLMRPLSHCSVSLIKKFAPFCFSGCTRRNFALVFCIVVVVTGLNLARYSSYHHLLHLRLGPLFTSFLAEWWMSFGVWRSCNKAEIQMRLGLTFPSRAHGKHGKLFQAHAKARGSMAHGKHGPGQTHI